jgi:hypothetical protein
MTGQLLEKTRSIWVLPCAKKVNINCAQAGQVIEWARREAQKHLKMLLHI